MYTLFGYGSMIADRVRTGAYSEALCRTVRPGSVVLDIGTGVGILAIMACRLGAARVYAVEPDDVIEIAREIAAANGVADRIVFIQDMSTRVTLPEQADVIVSDLHGVLPLYQQSLASIMDARRRFLAPGGSLIPRAETVRGAVVRAPELYERVSVPWDERPFGMDMTAARRMVSNLWYKGVVTPEQLSTQPALWAKMDYLTLEDPNVRGTVRWTVETPGVAHGLVFWFDSGLTEGVGLSNAPGEAQLLFGCAFFPWTEPVELAAGDFVSTDLQARFIGGDYIWNWETVISSAGEGGETKAHFKQSTFKGTPLSPARLKKMAATHVPRLSEEGEVFSFTTSLMNGDLSLMEIAERLAERFPSRFTTAHNAFDFTAGICKEYGR